MSGASQVPEQESPPSVMPSRDELPSLEPERVSVAQLRSEDNTKSKTEGGRCVAAQTGSKSNIVNGQRAEQAKKGGKSLPDLRTTSVLFV